MATEREILDAAIEVLRKIVANGCATTSEKYGPRCFFCDAEMGPRAETHGTDCEFLMAQNVLNYPRG